ncbi:MAG TPA: hypothetical protein QF468_10440 [Nitrospinota bacterium]|jgi:hypothetical protein|nr:hypothetical protein [Nitrospinota bacterium]
MCDLNNIIRWMLLIGGLVAGAIAAASAALGLPSFAGAAMAAVAAGFAAAALFAVSGLESAFAAYIACRDSADGATTSCPTLSVNGHFGAFKVLLGIAISVFLFAAVAEIVPALGDFFGVTPLAAGIAACVIVLGLLASLLVFINLYKTCRDRAARPGPGQIIDQGADLTTGGE